ncbi:MAG: type I restriction enzyme HsdR N-terminal domain-containing protein, partial [Bacteroidota bacterium]|nr:type I restriction enzyme HsdR N-terminal domain-containing protein [Bacteroidota bacterium]
NLPFDKRIYVKTGISFTMLQLNLPPFDHNLKKERGKLYIFDSVRKKFVLLTPEEWVRQHFVWFLITQKKVSLSLVGLEKSRKYNEIDKRTDIIVWKDILQPWLLVECKSSHINVDDHGVFQLLTYNKSLQAPFLAVTNGITHKYFQKIEDAYFSINELPDFK